MNNTVYVEYGLDFDNNRFGLGRSVEIEQSNGSEIRTKNAVRLSQKRFYFRLWMFKRVLIISGNGIEFITKGRHNFKIIVGVCGIETS